MESLKEEYEDEVDLISEFCLRKNCSKCLDDMISGEKFGYCEELLVFIKENEKRIKLDFN